MRKRLLLLIVAVICIFGSFGMYFLYASYDYQIFKYIFWIPIPIAFFALLETKRMDP